MTLQQFCHSFLRAFMSCCSCLRCSLTWVLHDAKLFFIRITAIWWRLLWRTLGMLPQLQVPVHQSIIWQWLPKERSHICVLVSCLCDLVISLKCNSKIEKVMAIFIGHSTWQRFSQLHGTTQWLVSWTVSLGSKRSFHLRQLPPWEIFSCHCCQTSRSYWELVCAALQEATWVNFCIFGYLSDSKECFKLKKWQILDVILIMKLFVLRFALFTSNGGHYCCSDMVLRQQGCLNSMNLWRIRVWGEWIEGLLNSFDLEQFCKCLDRLEHSPHGNYFVRSYLHTDSIVFHFPLSNLGW